MRATVLPYWRLFVAGLRQQSTYRLAAFGGLVANTTFGFLKIAMLLATVAAAGGELQGYDAGSMSAYVWLSQGLLGSVNLFGRTDFADRIKSGDVAVDLARPVSPQLAAIATEAGAAVFTILPRGLPSVLLGAVVVGMTMPTTAWPYVLGAASLVVGIVVSHATVYAVNTVGFWLVESRGVQVLYMVVSGFFAGLFVPIGFFPDALLRVAEATPFPSMMMYPIDILSGRVTGPAALGLFGVQLLWLGVSLAAGAALTLAGRRRLEVQGG